MKISNETKVGTLTIIALTILILGFNFLKGKDILNKRKKIYAIFKDIGSLSKSNEVKINGYVIGSVYEIRARDKDLSGVVVTINLTQEVNIPQDSKALISSPFVGSSYLIIEKGLSNKLLMPGDTLLTRMDSSILDDVKAQLAPTLEKVRSTLDTFSTVMGSINSMFNAQARNNIGQTLSNLNRASASLEGLLDNQTSALAKTLDNAKTITESLKGNTESINATIQNAKTASEKLAALELKPVVDSLNSFISDLKTTIRKIDNKDGTLGALINDRTVYNNLKNVTLSMEILMDDIKTHPKRYVNFSLFGRKDRSGGLNSPLIKDTTHK
jgi:phospholipid/cholesterol/gamma-HCH transport system substrate-binding protein